MHDLENVIVVGLEEFLFVGVNKISVTFGWVREVF
jgi:hypothetical protein